MKAKIVSILSSIGALIMGFIGGSCGVACLAGGCCGGTTVLLGFLSVSSSSLRFLEKLTPVFLTLTILSLGYGFYKAYKPVPASCCAENNSSLSIECCEKEKKQSFLKSKTFLWITTIICVIMWLYPYVFKNEIKTNIQNPPLLNLNDSLIGPKSFKIQTNSCDPKL